jgi:hypothetical protein
MHSRIVGNQLNVPHTLKKNIPRGKGDSEITILHILHNSFNFQSIDGRDVVPREDLICFLERRWF